MEKLQKELDRLIATLPNAEDFRHKLKTLVSVYPFNDYEYIIAALLAAFAAATVSAFTRWNRDCSSDRCTSSRTPSSMPAIDETGEIKRFRPAAGEEAPARRVTPSR